MDKLETVREKKDLSPRMRVLQLLLLCAVGILINFLGTKMVEVRNLPMYQDCLGTVLVAALGGYIPGIVVGYLINLINGFGDGVSAYYGALSVMIAVATVIMAERGWFRRLWGCIGAVLVYALIGGALGSVLTWCLYGMGFGEGFTAPLAHRFYEGGIHSIFLAQLLADFLYDLLDKAVIVLLAFLVLKLIPEDVSRRMKIVFWRQTPLSREEQAQARHVEIRGSSIRTRITVLLFAALMIVVAVTVGICFTLFHQSTIEAQGYMAQGVANVASEGIDPELVDEYVRLGSAVPGYDEAEEYLTTVRNSSGDIEYIYAYQILEDGCHVVFDPDTEDMPGEEHGTVIPFDESFLPYLPELLAGQPIDPIVSNDSYGWLLTVYKPIYNAAGQCVCYLGVDISMTDLLNGELSFFAKVISLFLAFALLIIAIGLWLADCALILPLNSMAIAAGKFAYGRDVDEGMNVEAIRRLNIRTGDEIENLYKALSKTSEDMVAYVREVEEKNATITRMQDSLIAVLADMVESRDKHTGHHIKKTAAYARIIMEEMRREGIHTDMLTDEYINDVVRSAPLHDVGKIEVPDALLNKPGKLTDEEFAQMKNHTIAGQKIIARSAEAVAGSDYLKKAEDLAAYHHERWDGKGYPYGKAGEDIPISARVMAVADVFDALVSKRSYKEGFPIEKALAIITEGIGTQFDPEVAGAFLRAEPEVRRVAQEHSEHEC